MPTDREKHTSPIWVTPPDQALECLATLVQAKDLDELICLSLPFQSASIDRAEHRLEMQLERMGPVGATLRREMRPSLLERFEHFWQNLRDRFGGRMRTQLRMMRGRNVCGRLPTITALRQQETLRVSQKSLFCGVAKVSKRTLALIGTFATISRAAFKAWSGPTVLP